MMSDELFDRRSVKHPTGGESKTKQADAKGADVNVIVNQWLKTGVPPVGGGVARYGDFSNADDYLSCCLKVQEAEDSFARLPAKVKQACGQSPARFLEMVYDPEKRAELEELGLVEVFAPADAPAAEAVSDEGPASDGSETPEVPA